MLVFSILSPKDGPSSQKKARIKTRRRRAFFVATSQKITGGRRGRAILSTTIKTLLRWSIPYAKRGKTWILLKWTKALWPIYPK